MTDSELVENIKLAFELQKQGQYREAIASLYKVLDIAPDNVSALIQIAYIFYICHDLDLSKKYYEKVLEILPKNEFSFQGLLSIYKQKGEYKKALDFAVQLHNIKPNLNNFIQLIEILLLSEEYEKIPFLFLKSSYVNEQNEFLNLYVGIAYFNMQKYELAKQYLQPLVENDSKNIKALIYLAKIAYYEEDYHLSNCLLNNALRIQESAEVYNLKGFLHLCMQNYIKAASLFLVAVKLDSKNHEYVYNLGIAYTLNGWLVEAEQCFLTAVRLNPDNILYHYTLAYLYYEMKKIDKTEHELEFILSKEPEYTDAKILKAMITTSRNELLKARDMLEEIVKNADDNDFAFYALGIIYKKMNLFGKAIEMFVKAHTIKTTSEEYVYEIAFCLYKAKQFTRAAYYIQTLLKISPRYVDAYILKANIQIERKDFADAELTLSQVLALDKNCAEYYYLRAQIYVEKDLPSDAIKEAEHALSLEPDNPIYYNFIAKVCEKHLQYRDALAFYEELTEIIYKPELFLSCARCAEKIKDKEKAQKYYFRAYVTNPQDIGIMMNYIDFMLKNRKYIQAIRFIKKRLSKTQIAENIEVLRKKYQTVKEQYYSTLSPLQKAVCSILKV